jgi:O-antigen/teichoic acid export membrane protein
MPDNLSHKAFKAVRWTTLNTICQVGIQFLSLFILGRLLTPQAFGLMAMIMVVIEIVNFFARMGLSEAIIYKKNVSESEISSLYILNISVGFTLFLIVFFSSGLISRLYSEPALVPLVRIMSSLFFISSLGVIFEILLRKNLLFGTVAKVNICAHFSSFVLMVILAFQGAEVYALVFGQLLSHTLKAGLLIFSGIKNKWFPTFHFSFSEIKFYLKFGLYRVLAMSANQFNSRVDQFLIGAMLGSVALGFYNVAFRIIYLPVNQVNPILTQVAFPFFSKIQDDTSRLKRNYLKYINLILSINAPVLAGITALAPILVPLLLGEKWIPSVPIIQALSFYVFIRSIFNASGSLMMAKGKADWTFYWCMVMLLLIPTTTYATLKLSGSVVQVCLALGGIFFIFFFFHYTLFLRNLLGGFFKEYVLTIARPLSLAVSMGGFTYLLSISLRGWPDLITASILIPFGVGYYAIATLCFNPLFVDELEKILPSRVSTILSCIRYKFNVVYAFANSSFGNKGGLS